MFNSGIGADGEPKDTPRNAVDTGEFVVNVVTEELIEQMDITADDLPPEEGEFVHADIESTPSETVAPPRVADAALSMECTLYDSMNIYDRKMMLGEVVRYHVAEEIMTDGKVDMNKVTTVGRLGGSYCTTGSAIEFERR